MGKLLAKGVNCVTMKRLFAKQAMGQPVHQKLAHPATFDKPKIYLGMTPFFNGPVKNRIPTALAFLPKPLFCHCGQ